MIEDPIYPAKDVKEIEDPRKIPGNYWHFLYKDIKWQDEYGQGGWTRNPANPDDAEVVSSEIYGGLHCPVLDIDIPAFLIPSSTPGHSHLYIDHPMKWRKYKRLLRALARAGIVEKGYVKASIYRKHTAVRVPWVKKES